MSVVFTPMGEAYFGVRLFYQLLALPAFLLSLGVVVGYVRLLPRERGVVLFFAWSHVLIFGASALRSFFWATKTMLFPEVPPPFAILRAVVNVPLDLLVIVAAYCALQAMFRMIPTRDRPAYRWWSAPTYPPWSLSDMIRRAFKVDRRHTPPPDPLPPGHTRRRRGDPKE